MPTAISIPNWPLLLAILVILTSIALATLSSPPLFNSQPNPPTNHHHSDHQTNNHPKVHDSQECHKKHPLIPHLSPQALLLLPTDPYFRDLTRRWSSSPLNTPPPPSLVVVPATEGDISATIRYANGHGLDFLATTGGHGTGGWLRYMGGEGGEGRDAGGGGALIYMRNLTRFEVLEHRHHGDGDGKGGRTADCGGHDAHAHGNGECTGGDDTSGSDTAVAILGGGLLSSETIDKLWTRGWQTTTGICACVSFAGPALGGGHGMLQGQYGLVADQLVSARVVLADGEAVKVSETERADLFWALRGAGHNFGVVTEFRVRVHRVEEHRREWAYEMFVFSGERLEEVYALVERMTDAQPAHAVHWSVWKRDLEVDLDKPVIAFMVFYNGPMEECKRYSAQIHALRPAAYASGTTQYPGISAVMGLDVNSPVCQPQGTALLRGIDVDHYEIPALRKWFDKFSDMLATDYALAGSFCMLEGYSVQAVHAVPAASTAFAHRHQRLLLAPFISYTEVGNSILDEKAQRWSKAMETAALGSSKRRTYVNYAYGDESFEALYGYERWRLDKLRALKQEYDPENRFRFFGPLEQEATQ